MAVHRSCHVQFDRSFYSVPFALAGKTLWLRATDNTVAVHEDYRHVYTHLRSRRPDRRMTVANHLPPEARQFFERDRRWCCQRAAEVGPVVPSWSGACSATASPSGCARRRLEIWLDLDLRQSPSHFRASRLGASRL